MRAIWMRLAVLVTVLSLAAGCAQLPQGAQPTRTLPTAQPTPAPQPTATARQSTRVLFIGDSLSLGLDGLFPRLAASGSPPVIVENELVWSGATPLEWHWELTKARSEVGTGKWNTVVLEEDLADRWPDGVDKYHQYARQFDQEIKKAGAETVLVMAYPDSDAEAPTTEDMAAAYGKSGQELGVKVAPVALAFRRSLQERPDLKLHAADGDHPSWAGVYLLGCVLYATIFERSPVGLTYRMTGTPTDGWQISAQDQGTMRQLSGEDWQMSEEDAAFLQRIAWETVGEYQAGR
jgi:hypothetical protein